MCQDCKAAQGCLAHEQPIQAHSPTTVYIELLDIEEEGSDFEELSIRAIRSVKTCPTQALMGKGPILD